MSSKDTTLYCRVGADMKDKIEREARLRGESASVIIREALREYFEGDEKTFNSLETSRMDERLAKPKRAA